MGRKPKQVFDPDLFDVDLDDLPPDLRWRTWMGRAEAVIFASPAPVSRETLLRVVGPRCNIDALIADIRDELLGRPYELVSVAGGWQHRTKKTFADAIRAAVGVDDKLHLSKLEGQVLTAIAYFQPMTRQELSAVFGRDISRDVLADLRAYGLIASGPRSPRAGAPLTYVTTPEFLSRFGFVTLRDLPDMEKLEDAGLLSKERLIAGDLHDLFGIADSSDNDQDQADVEPELADD
jgi:segregation and condensation protein B